MNSQQIEVCLAQPHAPQGDPRIDLKTALYLACCSRTLDLNNALSLGALGLALGELGFTGELGTIDYAQLRHTLDDLTRDGALREVRSGVYHVVAEGQACSGILKYEEPPDGEGGYYIEGAEGERITIDVLDFTALPGDEVNALLLSPVQAMLHGIVAERQFVLGRPAALSTRDGERWILMVDEHALRGYEFVFQTHQDLGEAQSGDVVIARITRRRQHRIWVAVSEVVRSLGSLDRFILEAVIANDIPSVWPSGMHKALAGVPEMVAAEDIRGRVDLRSLPLVTIDGEDARDFDDAVYARHEGQNFRLYVAIADVSYYVRPRTLLDSEALNRCNSVYFPNFVIPMLPEKLSNGICSLNPGVDRLCMVCEMLISQEGQTLDYAFYPAVMNSHARLTYTEAQLMLSQGQAQFPEHAPRIAEVRDLYELFVILQQARTRRGAINAESDEVHFIFNEKLEITGIDPLVRNTAHMLIEECMIAANVCAARFVEDRHAAALYRVHQKPLPDKLAMLQASLRGLRLSLPGGDQPSSLDFAQFLARQAKRPDFRFVQSLILRAMSKAQYSPDNIGHFGLALEQYAHFTSPIRRYSDLQLHRVIKYLLNHESKSGGGGGLSDSGERSYTHEELVALGLRCTQREIAAQRAEFEVDGKLKCAFLADFVGYHTTGIIAGVNSFGAFVYLDKFCISGLIFVGNLERGAYVTYEEDKGWLAGAQRTYKVGDRLAVTIASVNVEEAKIDLVPYEPRKSKRGRKVQTQSQNQDEDGRLQASFKAVDELIARKRAAAVTDERLHSALRRSSMSEHLDTCTRRRHVEPNDRYASRDSSDGTSYLDVVQQGCRPNHE